MDLDVCIGNRRCSMAVFGQADTTTWYLLWEASMAIFWKCLNRGMKGSHRGLGMCLASWQWHFVEEQVLMLWQRWWWQTVYCDQRLVDMLISESLDRGSILARPLRFSLVHGFGNEIGNGLREFFCNRKSRVQAPPSIGTHFYKSVMRFRKDRQQLGLYQILRLKFASLFRGINQ